MARPQNLSGETLQSWVFGSIQLHVTPCVCCIAASGDHVSEGYSERSAEIVNSMHYGKPILAITVH